MMKQWHHRHHRQLPMPPRPRNRSTRWHRHEYRPLASTVSTAFTSTVLPLLLIILFYVSTITPCTAISNTNEALPSTTTNTNSHTSSKTSSSTSTNQKPINRCPLRPPSTLPTPRPPLIIGHRGSSFHLPEHTLPSYKLALELGADYIEPDLVPTQDGVLVAHHSIDLNFTTNVDTYNNGEFRYKARVSEANHGQWGYYIHDFTWEEVQQLRVRQRVAESGARSTHFDDLFGIPSFSQIVSLLHEYNTHTLPLLGLPHKTGGVPGMYVELKQSSFFHSDANLSIAELFLDELAHHPKASELLFDHERLCQGLRYDEYRVPPMVIQSFEGGDLEYLRRRFRERWMDFVEEDAILEGGEGESVDVSANTNGTNGANGANGANEASTSPGAPGAPSDTNGGDTNENSEDDDSLHPWIPPLVLLVDSTYCKSTQFWFEIEKLHISGLGPAKECFLPSLIDISSNNTIAIERAKREAFEWVTKAHSVHGLAVHPWTVREELEVVPNHQGPGQPGGVPALFSSIEEELKYYFCDLKIDGIFTENIASARVVAARGCGEEASSGKKKGTGLFGTHGGPVCLEEERSLWFFGLAFGAIGALLGFVMTCFLSSALSKRGYCGGTGVGGVGHARALEVATAEDVDDGNGIL